MQLATSYINNFDDAGKIVQATRRNFVQFFIEPLHHEQKSNEAGRPIFHEVEMIKIIVPGDMKSIVVRRSTPEDRQMYAREYEAFKRSETIAMEGTPIEHWNILTRAQVSTLKHVNVHTIEQLANLSDEQLSDMNILGSRTLRKQAQIYLSQAGDGAEAAKMVADNQRMADEIANLRNQLTNAAAMYEQLARSKGHDASMDDIRVAPHVLHPAQAVQTAEPPKGKAKNHDIPENWSSMKDGELMRLARTLSPAPIKSRADAVAVIEEIIAS